MNHIIVYFAKRTKLDGFEYEDVKHLIISLILDGIKRYNNQIPAKVSTFLFTHIKNRLNNIIEKELTKKNNPSKSHERFRFNCLCGFSLKTFDKKHTICYNCNLITPLATKLKKEKNYFVQLN